MNNDNSLVNKRIKEYFDVCKNSDIQIFNSLSFYIYSLGNSSHDLYMLAKILDNQSLSNLISYYDGSTIKVPSKDEFVNLKVVAVCFFLREIKKWDWEKIKKFIDIEDDEFINSYALGKKLSSVKKIIFDEIESKLQDIDFDEVYIKEFIGEYLND